MDETKNVERVFNTGRMLVKSVNSNETKIIDVEGKFIVYDAEQIAKMNERDSE